MKPKGLGWSPKLPPGPLAESLITYCSLLIDPRSGAAVGLAALASGRLGATMGCIREMQFQERLGAAAEPQDIGIPELRTPPVGGLAPVPPRALGAAACELPRRPTAEPVSPQNGDGGPWLWPPAEGGGSTIRRMYLRVSW